MKKQIENIDNILITACIAIIAAYVVILSSNETYGFYFKLSTIFSVSLLIICLLLTLYGKYRASLRKEIFDQQKEEWKKNLDGDLDKMMKDFVAPQLIKATKTVLENADNKEVIKSNPKKITELLDNEWSVWKKDLEYPTKIFAENQGLKVQKMLDDSFKGLLNEKKAILKYQLEVFASKRYLMFVSGLILFICSVATKMF